MQVNDSFIDLMKYVIPSILTLIGVIITVRKSHADTKAKIEEQSKLTLYRIDQLEKKQDRYNNLQERMIMAEHNIKRNAENIDDTNHRIDELKHGIV